ncbi:hypothetical protein ALC60_14857 [Trachymyrmex zeteki]|uniref:Uncharacterized protein n=1 Tax=Mycetomoellerius zeteki TaxID=64791 RepID=A0A151WEA0_9HYME|nr:hypothetical protein ALC60_14857 [Trachymyrmex zeteki]
MASRLGFFRDASKKVENRDVPQNSGQLIILFTNVGKNGIKLNAASPNIEAIKVNPNLAKAGLKVIKNKKYNPRLIIHSIPAELKVRKRLVNSDHIYLQYSVCKCSGTRESRDCNNKYKVPKCNNCVSNANMHCKPRLLRKGISDVSEDIKSIVKWTHSNRLLLNFDKMQAIIFGLPGTLMRSSMKAFHRSRLVMQLCGGSETLNI